MPISTCNREHGQYVRPPPIHEHPARGPFLTEPNTAAGAPYTPSAMLEGSPILFTITSIYSCSAPSWGNCQMHQLKPQLTTQCCKVHLYNVSSHLLVRVISLGIVAYLYHVRLQADSQNHSLIQTWDQYHRSLQLHIQGLLRETYRKRWSR